VTSNPLKLDADSCSSLKKVQQQPKTVARKLTFTTLAAGLRYGAVLSLCSLLPGVSSLTALFKFEENRTPRCMFSTRARLTSNIQQSRSQLSLVQNMFVVSADKISLVSTLQTDTIYMIRSQPILKIIIGIGWLKVADTNKCPAGRYLRHYWYRLS
jgi:hypothetical protein